MHQANMNISISMSSLAGTPLYSLQSPQPFLFGRRLSPLLISQPHTILSLSPSFALASLMYVFVVSRYPNLVYILLEKIECRQDEAVLNWKLSHSGNCIPFAVSAVLGPIKASLAE